MDAATDSFEAASSSSTSSASTHSRRFLIITIGTRGDMQPYVALARSMQAAGWTVAIAGSEGFDGFVKEHAANVEYFPLLGNPAAIVNSPQFIKAFYEGGMKEQMDVMLKESMAWTEPNYYRTWEIAKQFQPDLILTGITTLSEVLAIGQKLRVPVVTACTIPLYPTSEMGPVTAMVKPLPFGFLNSLAHWAGFKVLWSFLSGTINKFRASLELNPQPSYVMDAAPILCLYSELVAPRPKDWPTDLIEITGYWDLKTPDDYEPPQELSEFLEAGEAPVFMGFGSMPLKNPLELAMDYCHVLKKLNRRGLIQLGWSKEKDAVADALREHPHVLLLSDVPHDWLFSRCSTIIHHGGAGTTAASLRSGVPSIIYPVLVDQPYWASRVGALGAGPKTVIPLKQLTRENLESQIIAASDEAILQRAREVAEALRQEADGVPRAVEFLERFASLPSHPRNFPSSTPCGEDGSYQWTPDHLVNECQDCKASFSFLNRRHHCRLCGNIYCGYCITRQMGLLNHPRYEALPVCRSCLPPIQQ